LGDSAADIAKRLEKKCSQCSIVYKEEFADYIIVANRGGFMNSWHTLTVFSAKSGEKLLEKKGGWQKRIDEIGKWFDS
jgi:hypothetical protein